MAFSLAGRSISRLAVIGSGNIGPDMALYFARMLTRHGVPILVHDVSAAALHAGRDRVLQKLRRGGETGVFSAAEIEVIERNVTFTLDKSLLMGCDFVIEAVTEDLS